MKLLKRFICLLLCLILVLPLTACDNSDKAYIYFNLTETPQSLDPQTASTDAELIIIRNIFEGLLRKDENGKVVCGVAESYKKDGLKYTFKLRKNAVWSNGENVTAYDFQFALRRAVNPETKAPFAIRLSAIKNAQAIIKGKKSIYDLGVQAKDSRTLEIILAYEDAAFEETLTTSIAMPCSEAFFRDSAGKYGLKRDAILSNGSYYLAKWNKDNFGIRLYRNEDYKGPFTAKNAAVFFSTDKERDSIKVLSENDADIAFITPQEISPAKKEGLKIQKHSNVYWFLTVSDGFSEGVRKSLISLATPQVFKDNLTEGYGTSNNIFPEVLDANASSTGMPIYDLENAQKLFTNEINKLKDKKFPTDVVLYYFDNGFSKTLVTDIVGHWQNRLGAFINIKTVSSPAVLTSQLKNQTYALSIFPIKADSTNLAEYLQNFGIEYKGGDLNKVQSQILNSYNIAPLATQSTVIAYRKSLTKLNFSHGNGCIDFAFVVKED